MLLFIPGLLAGTVNIRAFVTSWAGRHYLLGQLSSPLHVGWGERAQYGGLFMDEGYCVFFCCSRCRYWSRIALSGGMFWRGTVFCIAQVVSRIDLSGFGVQWYWGSIGVWSNCCIGVFCIWLVVRLQRLSLWFLRWWGVGFHVRGCFFFFFSFKVFYGHSGHCSTVGTLETEKAVGEDMQQMSVDSTIGWPHQGLKPPYMGRPLEQLHPIHCIYIIY